AALRTSTPSSSVAGGPYAIHCVKDTLASGNYSFSFVDGHLAITKAPLTVTGDDTSREYGEPNPGFTATISGYKNGETRTTSDLTGSPSCSSAATPSSSVAGGPYAIHCVKDTLASGNYSFSFVDGHLAIKIARATGSGGDTAREYGEPNQGFTAKISGHHNGETR